MFSIDTLFDNVLIPMLSVIGALVCFVIYYCNFDLFKRFNFNDFIWCCDSCVHALTPLTCQRRSDTYTATTPWQPLSILPLSANVRFEINHNGTCRRSAYKF